MMKQRIAFAKAECKCSPPIVFFLAVMVNEKLSWCT